ncbi:DUF4870 domain-containing protein [Paenibacillus turpanensis]|uniref:DUF4870 domain-containing protein n=1 Tax=Paenibacillus turpanensis TaxID=2689078 RepID=UPI00140DE1C1|nr:DUF4870 domain-containing protein [Paenibacillus turpanensis]
METNKILSALAYLSIFFAPFLVPIIIYFVTNDREVKRNSLEALLAHLLPLVSIFGFVFLLAGSFIGTFTAVFILLAILSTISFIWSVVRGIQVLIR